MVDRAGRRDSFVSCHALQNGAHLAAVLTCHRYGGHLELLLRNKAVKLCIGFSELPLVLHLFVPFLEAAAPHRQLEILKQGQHLIDLVEDHHVDECHLWP